MLREFVIEILCKWQIRLNISQDWYESRRVDTVGGLPVKFKPIASSSKGNCYIVEAEGSKPLLLEAGIPIKKIREALNFGLSNLAGCLISHEHL